MRPQPRQTNNDWSAFMRWPAISIVAGAPPIAASPRQTEGVPGFTAKRGSSSSSSSSSFLLLLPQMQVKNPRAGILHQPNQPNENSRAEKSHIRAKFQRHPRVAAPRFFSHLANELSKIPSDCPRSNLPIVISGRLGGLPVHEPLPF